VLNTTWYESNAILGFFPSLVFFNSWLCILLILHTYWFSLIVKVAYAALTKATEVSNHGLSFICTTKYEVLLSQSQIFITDFFVT